MNKISYKYLYGPVYSWRLGMSLGVDPISVGTKTCNYDCVYCQLGKTLCFETERKIFVPAENIIKEIKSLPDVEIDYITFSGSGEPTLAKNLSEMIDEIKRTRREKIAVITNSSLMDRKDVHEDLEKCDFVLAKLDACCSESFLNINQPADTINFDSVVEGLCSFKKVFKGKFALQIMFVDENVNCAEKIAEIAQNIGPDEVQINTPLRPCATKPLTRNQMSDIKRYFKSLDVTSVYDVETKKYQPFDDQKTANRHGNFNKSPKN